MLSGHLTGQLLSDIVSGKRNPLFGRLDSMPKIHETTRSEIIGEALRSGLDFDELLSHDGPGRFEGNPDRPLAVAVDDLAADADESTGDVASPTGHVSRVDRWLRLEDDRGFISVIEYDTEDSARKAFTDYDDEFAAWVDCDEEN